MIEKSHGVGLPTLCRDIVEGLDPDRQITEARRAFSVPEDEEPTEEQVKQTA